MEQSYEITEDGKAKTLNPLGKKMDYSVKQKLNQQPQYDMFWINLPNETKYFDKKSQAYDWIDEQNKAWQQAEDSRVTYEIEPTWDKIYFDPKDSTQYKLRAHKHTPGTIVKGTLENGKIRIL